MGSQVTNPNRFVESHFEDHELDVIILWEILKIDTPSNTSMLAFVLLYDIEKNSIMTLSDCNRHQL